MAGDGSQLADRVRCVERRVSQLGTAHDGVGGHDDVTVGGGSA
jgi:hypothetical protein